MNLTLQERGPRWLGLFAGHGPHGAGACRALFVEAEFRHCGTILAPALSIDREKQQQHILMPASAKATPAQRHAHHCSICGPQHRHTGVPAHTRTHTHAHAHTHTNTNARAHIHTHKHTGTHARAHTHTHTHIHTYTHTHA